MWLRAQWERCGWRINNAGNVVTSERMRGRCQMIYPNTEAVYSTGAFRGSFNLTPPPPLSSSLSSQARVLITYRHAAPSMDAMNNLMEHST
ncbi:hypothetical protein J6590_014083 [Homalodisca vitripennis]|nr:hypothetical protein J6590_014083 [Homalodisca vitripennis]